MIKTLIAILALIQTAKDLNPPPSGLVFISLSVIDHEEYESALQIKFFVGLKNLIKQEFLQTN